MVLSRNTHIEHVEKSVADVAKCWSIAAMARKLLSLAA